MLHDWFLFDADVDNINQKVKKKIKTIRKHTMLILSSFNI